MTVVCSSGVLFGGIASSGANAGLSFANSHSAAATFAYVGSQLY